MKLLTGKTHTLGGMTLAAGLSLTGLCAPDTIANTVLWLGYLTAAGAGALLPDIDHRQSSVSHKHKVAAFFVNLFMGHRGFTHSLLSLFLVSLLALLLVQLLPYPTTIYIVVGFLFGYASHIILDCLNPAGVPLFYPIKKDKISIGKIRTGGVVELVIFLLLIIVFVFVINQNAVVYHNVNIFGFIKQCISYIKGNILPVIYSFLK